MKRKVVALLVLAAMLLAMLPGVTFAAGTVYQVAATDTAATIEGVINGTITDAAGDAYTGIFFPAGTYTYSFTNDMLPNRNFTFETASGAVVTVDKGFSFPATALAQDVTFQGAGSFVIDGTDFGISGVPTAAVNLLFKSGSFYIKNTTNAGIYMQDENGGWASSSLCVSGGYFEVSGCANTTAWNGIDIEAGIFKVSNGAEMVLKDNSNANKYNPPVLLGDAYFQNVNPIVEGAGTKLSVSSSVAYISVRLSGSSVFTVRDGGIVSVVCAGPVPAPTVRDIGFLGSGTTAGSKIEVLSGGKLTVTSATGQTHLSGIGRLALVVGENAVVSVSGFSWALDSSMLYASASSHVTLDGTVSDNAYNALFPAHQDGSVITGGSVKEDPKISIVSGQWAMTGAPLYSVETAPVNAAGETLTRFDLAIVKMPQLARESESARGNIDLERGGLYCGGQNSLLNLCEFRLVFAVSFFQCLAHGKKQ